MTKSVTILSVMDTLFGSFFEGPSWDAWRVCLAALFGLPMTERQREVYRACTKREQSPTTQAREAWLICGRRAGKTRILALLAVFFALIRQYKLAKGEIAVAMLLATDRKQAQVLFKYARALVRAVPMLERRVISETKETITFRASDDPHDLEEVAAIEVHTSSFRSVRGRTVVFAAGDESAFWEIDADSANPDTEVYNALRPAMSTIPNAMLLGASSPYARRGALWIAFDHHFGKDGDPVLVWKASTEVMNPAVDRSIIAQAYADDEAAADAEYGANFRRDVERVLSIEAIRACTPPGRLALAPMFHRQYVGFVDPSGGSDDSMTLAIAHQEGMRPVLDLLVEVTPPFSPEEVVGQFVADLRRYRLSSVIGDRYGSAWVQEQFTKRRIHYRVSEETKSELYRSFIPLVNSGACELLDVPKLAKQLQELERNTSRGGRDMISHPPRGHDDVANAAAGALVNVKKAVPMMPLVRARSFGLTGYIERRIG